MKLCRGLLVVMVLSVVVLIVVVVSVFVRLTNSRYKSLWWLIRVTNKRSVCIVCIFVLWWFDNVDNGRQVVWVLFCGL